MTTSGTFNFQPSLGELGLYAFNNAGVRSTAITQEHMESLRMASNMLQVNWANRGVNLWAVDLQTINLVQGQSTYTVPANTVVILDVYAGIVNGSVETDRILLPISRSEYANYPNKNQQGFPTTYWFDRLIAPTITLWLVPDGTSAQVLKYYRVRQLQDATFPGGSSPEVQFLWLEAYADALSYRLSRIWNPAMSVGLKAVADESYNIAANQNVETAQQYITPQLSGYYRP